MKQRLISLFLACLLTAVLFCGCAQTENTTPKSPEEMYSIAETYLERDVDDLIAVIGEPQSRSYATSCGGEGEDGELVYDGFTVYTFRTDDYEIVKDVWAD